LPRRKPEPSYLLKTKQILGYKHSHRLPPCSQSRREQPAAALTTNGEKRPMDLGIAGRTAIVCASSRGLGKACAQSLAQAGVNVVINGRDEAALNETAQEIAKQNGVTVTPVIADVSTPEGQKKLLAAAPEPDILVNNNGGPPRKDYSELHREAMVQGVVMNMVTPIELIQAVIGPMTQRGFGRIVNITSASVKRPLTGLDLSSGARAGLTAFLAGVARQVAPRGVTINHILPGAFDTDRLRSGIQVAADAQGVPHEKIAEARMAAIPVGRFGYPDEFGKACAFLCSVHAGYITGQNLLIDGGDFHGSF
jgi:3-oxoacyl-[acyl-carrier protein] reductase